MELVQEKWNEILDLVKEEHDLTVISYNTWLKPLEFIKVQDNTVYILVPSEQMALNYIIKKYTLPIKVAIAEITGNEYDVKFVSPDQADTLIINNNEETHSPVQEFNDLSLNPNYTFDTFIVGSNNRFAHSAALAVAESPGDVYNPLLLHGGAGLGKTHLMQSIAHFIKHENPSAVVRYVSSETFTNELIESIKNVNSNTMTNFRKKYRDVDVLLIDDIQFIIGKESTQEEFFNTFNELHSAKKQIIISSDKPPKDMQILEDRIRTRLEWGLLADIGSPDYETRMAILRKKVELDHFKLDDEILEYIATNIKSNIRELEGALNKLIAYYTLQKEDITLEVAQRELQNIITPDKPREITIPYIIDVVCDHFHITKADILSSKRNADIAYPRQIAFYLCRTLTSKSLKEVGNEFGKRDHTTVLHGVEKIEDEVDNDVDTRNLIDTLKKKINP